MSFFFFSPAKSLNNSLRQNPGLKLFYFFKWLKIISFKLIGSSTKTDGKQNTKNLSYFISQVKNTCKGKTVECEGKEPLIWFAGRFDLRDLILLFQPIVE